MRKRLIALLLTVAVSFGLLNFTVGAEEPEYINKAAEISADNKIIVEDSSPWAVYVLGDLNESAIQPQYNTEIAPGVVVVGDLSSFGFTGGDYGHLSQTAYNSLVSNYNENKNNIVAGEGYFATVKNVKCDLILQQFCDHNTDSSHFKSASNDTQHWEECELCGKEKPKKNHTFEYKDQGDAGHIATCKDCGYATAEAEEHEHNAEGICEKCGNGLTTTVTFMANGKEYATVPDQTCGKVMDATKIPEDPKPENNTEVFVGWYKGNDPFDPKTDVVTLDLTLTAKFASNTFPVETICDENLGTVTYRPKLTEDGKMAAGTTVTVYASPKDSEKYAVKSIVVDGAEATKLNDSAVEFVMPEAKVTVTVEFKKVTGGGGGTGTSKEYRVTVNYGAGGSATANPTSGYEGDEVTVTVKPDKGYVVQGVYAYDELLTGTDNVYTFTIQGEDAKVVVLFKPEDAADIEIKVETEGEVEGGNLSEEEAKSLANNSSIDDSLPMAQVQEVLDRAYRNKNLLETAARLFTGATAEDVELVVKAKLEFGDPRLRSSDEKNPRLTMDIVGYVQLYAVYKGDEEPVSGYRSQIKDSVTITVSLPDVFGKLSKPVYVGHKNLYQYDTEKSGNKFTFRNPHGFSEFKFGTVDEAVVRSSAKDYQYLTFNAAADEAEKDDVLTLKQSNGENVRLRKGVIVKLGTDKDGNLVKFSGTINGVRPRFDENDEYEVPTNGVSSGSGSGSSGNGANGKPSVVPGAGGTAPVEPGNPRSRFLDVAYGAFYFDAVEWAAENGITKGKDTGYFAPNDSCTRAEMVTFLWRAAGSPEPTTSSAKFTDVEAGKYYEKAVAWAVEKGITQGVSATSFAPNATVTRDQTVTFIYRSKGSPAANGGSSFSDVPANAYYANAVAWAVQAGVTNGTSATTFSPAKNCTRGEIVTFLYRSK